jgi:nucleoside-diphosphate-sugar epimerase
MNGKKIVLVGGAGFIGHNLALHLKSLGAEVTIIDSLQVNNLLSFSSTDKEVLNRSLYLKILQSRQSMLIENDIPLIVQDARNYPALS